jgi:3-methyladenine DNA glycosylase AlkC
MKIWAKHKNAHVRRLASEGCRPRLPWAMALPAFKKDPAPILPIIEMLINDESEYVRRSAANNLNDIAKDNPDVVLKFAKSRIGKSAETDKLLKHACRGLLKNGNTEALKIFGFKSNDNIKVKQFKTAPAVKIGEKLNVKFTVENTNIKPVKLRFEFGVYYLKQKGKLSRKIFKVCENTYKDKIISVERNVSFEDRTVRKHNTGKHKISLIINGVEAAIKEFVVK